MTSKKRLEKALKKARKTLVQQKFLTSPLFYIKSKNVAIPPVIIHPHWHDEASKTESFLELHKICRDIEAREVLIVGDILIYKGEDKKLTSEGIVVSLEDCTGIQSVILPYKMSGDGKITFGKESWETKREKELAFRSEGFVE